MEFQEVFNELKQRMKVYEDDLVVKVDKTDHYYLDTTQANPRNKKPIFFGAVQIKKNYVSYHLMPVYVYPELLNGISDAL